MLTKCSLGASVDLVHVALRAIDRDRYCCEQWFVSGRCVFYVPNDQREGVEFFRQLKPLLIDLSRLVVMGTGMSPWSTKYAVAGELAEANGRS